MSSLAVMLGIGLAAAAGYKCPLAQADSSDPSLSDAATLLSYLPDELTPTLGDTSQGATTLDTLDTAAQAAASSANLDALPATSAEDLWSEFLALINGVSPAPSTPGDYVGFSGDPSLLERVTTSLLDIAAPFEQLLGINFDSEIADLLGSNSPPTWLTALDGLDVTETTYDGMPVYEISSADPSGQYVVAIHGGAYVDEPTLLHWLSYTDMAHETGATVVVPIYPLATEGGTANVVVPEIAGLISQEISTEGASNVSVYGDSAGGGIALSAVELLVSEGKTVPDAMVLDSPSLEVALDNPDISLVDDPVLNLADLQADGQLWAGDLPETDPLVSPLYGSLEGLPDTYVYSGSDDLLAPDVLTLEQDAIAQDAPISFILRTGEIHDWALTTFGDGAQVQSQIYEELGLTDTSSSVSTSADNVVGALDNAVQTLSNDFSASSLTSLNLGELSTDLATAFSTVSTDLTEAASALSTTLSGDLSAWITATLVNF